MATHTTTDHWSAPRRQAVTLVTTGSQITALADWVTVGHIAACNIAGHQQPCTVLTGHDSRGRVVVVHAHINDDLWMRHPVCLRIGDTR